MEYIKLNLTPKSKDLGDNLYDEIYKKTANGLEISPKDEEFAIPWDASLYIEGDNVVIDGYVGPGGGSHSTCVAKIPLKVVNNYIELSVWPESHADEQDLIDMFSEYGWL